MLRSLPAIRMVSGVPIGIKSFIYLVLLHSDMCIVEGFGAESGKQRPRIRVSTRSHFGLVLDWHAFRRHVWRVVFLQF
jgi:hypothetical protein